LQYTITHKQYIAQHKKIHRTTQLEKKKECGRVRAVPRLKCEFYFGICLTTEEKAQKNLSQGGKTSVRIYRFVVLQEAQCVLCDVENEYLHKMNIF
jgi:hypothetical protein